MDKEVFLALLIVLYRFAALRLKQVPVWFAPGLSISRDAPKGILPDSSVHWY